MKRIPRRIFVAGLGPQEEFKREAIKLVNEQGLTISEACKKLDTRWPKAIATKSLRTWMKQESKSTNIFRGIAAYPDTTAADFTCDA